jgi:hypothetical protein
MHKQKSTYSQMKNEKIKNSNKHKTTIIKMAGKNVRL